MSAGIPSIHEVATVAPVATARHGGGRTWATLATAEKLVVTLKPLTKQVRCQRGHRGHLRTEDHGNDVSSNSRKGRA